MSRGSGTSQGFGDRTRVEEVAYDRKEARSIGAKDCSVDGAGKVGETAWDNFVELA
jgi:ribosome biogenesis SPOUT family RNA methylase Rps3